MSVTRKDFVAIAEAITLYAPAERRHLHDVMAPILMKCNPRFDMRVFCVACHLDPDVVLRNDPQPTADHSSRVYALGESQ